MKQYFILSILILILSTNSFANKDEQIELKFEGNIDSVLILANYYGNTFQVYDTIHLIDNSAIIPITDSLNEGVYTLAKFDKSKIIDFVVGNKKGFTLRAKTENLIDSIWISNSLENNYFFKYLQLNAKSYKLNQQLKSPKINDSQKAELEFEINFLRSELQVLNNEVHINIPNSVLDIIFTSMKEPKVPFMMQNDRIKSYAYFKSHYWDNIALEDVRMIRTPVFHNKLNFFFDRIVFQHPDSISLEINNLLNKSIDSEIKKYIIWNLALKYEEPKIMGLDKVFVNIIDTHFNSENMFDLTQSIIDNFKNRADKMRPTLIGSKAPNLIMIDSTGNYDALLNHFKTDYTLVLFWASDCQTCHKELNELKKFLKTTKHNIEVFAVGTDPSLEVWKKYIRDNDLNFVNVNGTQSITEDYHDLYNIFSTPTMFVLDKNQKIIGKNLIVAQLEGFLNHQSKMKNN